MSLTEHPDRHAPSLRLSALLLAAAIVASPGCSSNGGSGDATPVDLQTVLDLVISSGSGIRGADVDISFDASLVLVSVQPVGSFSGQTCSENLGVNFASLLCARDDGSTFNSPATLWRLTFEHSSVVDSLDRIFSVDCLASDAVGNTFPVACDLE